MRRMRFFVPVALAALVLPLVAAAAHPFPAHIDLPDGFRPEGIAIQGNTFYVGSIPTGAVVRGNLRTGTVSVNGGVWFGPDAPFGGYKESGLGREHGVEGFEEYLETKTLGLPT